MLRGETMFNNPYNFYPYMNQSMMNGMQSGLMRNAAGTAGMGVRNATRGGLFRSLSNIKWGNVLNNTQKTLNVINQAIPVYYQIKPIWGNLKSFGKIMSAFNEPDNNYHNYQTVNNQNRQNREDKQTEKKEDDGLPTFFIN